MVYRIGAYSGNSWINSPQKKDDPYDLDVKVEENLKNGDPIEVRTERNCSKACSHNCSYPCGSSGCNTRGCGPSESGSFCTC